MSRMSRDGSWKWVERSLGRDLEPIERQLVDLLCVAMCCGPYDLPGWSTRLRSAHDRHARFSLGRHIATCDNATLTRLVFGAHDRALRMSLTPAGFGGLEVQVWQRTRDPSRSRGHPRLAEAVSAWVEERPVEEVTS